MGQNRYMTFMRTDLATGNKEEHKFLETHYREVGAAPSPMAGMPVLEAYELVNKWNRDQYHAQYIFWLA